MAVMPLPNTKVIPAGWAEHHRGAVEQTMTGTCTLSRPAATGSQPLDPETGKYPTGSAASYYTGPCRVQAEVTDTRVEAAGDQLTVAGYLVVIRHDAGDVRVGDVVTVTAVDDNGDPTLVGRKLRVTGVARGTLVFETDLTCTAA